MTCFLSSFDVGKNGDLHAVFIMVIFLSGRVTNTHTHIYRRVGMETSTAHSDRAKQEKNWLKFSWVTIQTKFHDGNQLNRSLTKPGKDGVTAAFNYLFNNPSRIKPSTFTNPWSAVKNCLNQKQFYIFVKAAKFSKIPNMLGYI